MGWIGNIFCFIGLWLVGYKDRRAFLFTIAGEIIWIIAGLTRCEFDIVFICAAFTIVEARNWWLWNNDGTPDNRRRQPEVHAVNGRQQR